MLGQVRRTPPGLRLCSPLGEQMRLAALTAGPRAVGPQGAHPSPSGVWRPARAVPYPSWRKMRSRIFSNLAPFGLASLLFLSFSSPRLGIQFYRLEVFSRSPILATQRGQRIPRERILDDHIILRRWKFATFGLPQQPQLVCPMPRRDETDTLLAVADGGGTGTGGATSFNEHYWLMRTWPWSVA